MSEFIGFSKAVEDDIKELAALGNDIWREHYSSILSEEQIDYMLEKFQSESAIKEQIEQGYEYYFIKEDSNSIGYIGLCKKSEHLFLSKLYIKQDYRSKGYGKKAFNFVCTKCKDFGLDKIVLTVNKNNLNSIAFYEKIGLKKTDSVVCDIGDGFVMDDYIYTYSIS